MQFTNDSYSIVANARRTAKIFWSAMLDDQASDAECTHLRLKAMKADVLQRAMYQDIITRQPEIAAKEIALQVMRRLAKGSLDA